MTHAAYDACNCQVSGFEQILTDGIPATCNSVPLPYRPQSKLASTKIHHQAGTLVLTGTACDMCCCVLLTPTAFP